jgi:hypothetical protein
MDEREPKLLPLSATARVLHVPPKWLREQAEKGLIPSLDAAGSLLFHLPTVERMLEERASGKSAKEVASA